MNEEDGNKKSVGEKVAKVLERMGKWNWKKWEENKEKKRMTSGEEKSNSSGSENKERKNKHIIEMGK